MLTANLLSHQWKSFLRYERWRRNILSNIFYVVIILYFLIVFISFNFFIEKLNAQAGRNIIETFNSILIWYMSIDLLLRCLFQPMPAIEFMPYLRFCIRRSKLIHYLLVSSYLNLFNFFPLLIVVPLLIKLILPNYGSIATTLYILGFLMIVTFNNYLAVFLILLSQKKIVYLLIPVGILVFISIYKNNGHSILELSQSFGHLLIYGNPLILGILSSSIIILLLAARRFLLLNFYIDEVAKIEKQGISPTFEMGFLKSMNEVIQYMWLEVCLVIRNKRPRRVLSMLPIIMIYLLFMDIQENSNNSKSMILLLMSCAIPIGAVTYGQFLFSWESSYFDGIMARKNNFSNYVKAKYFLLIIQTLLIFIPFFFVFTINSKASLILLLSVLLFTLGFTCFIVLFFGTYNDRRIELDQNQWFKYHGFQGNHIILSLILMLFPVGIYLLFQLLINDTAGKLFIALPGLLFIIFHNWWINNIIVPRFMTRKYRNLEGYRKLSF